MCLCLFEWGVVCGKILKFVCTIFSNSYDDVISISVDAIITVICLGQLTSNYVEMLHSVGCFTW